MSIINTNAKEIHCKLIYYGPEHSGKKSAVGYIKDQLEKEKRDFWILPFKKEVHCLVLSVGKILGFHVFFHIYTLSNESQKDNKNLLKGVDGVLFMASADSQDKEKNIQSFKEMEQFLEEEGVNLFHFPLVLQYNKVDIDNPLPVKDLRLDLNKYNSRDFESSVSKGQRVFEPLKHLCKLTLQDLRQASA